MLYQPGHRKFEVEDPAALLEELCRHVPGTLVTHTAEVFRASILPMLFDSEDGPFGTLRGHLARGNPQWRDVGHKTHGLAFDVPDAYVSPAWYAEKRVTGKVVPTWNYTTVQAQGLLSVRHEPDWLLAHVRRLVERHEQQRPDPWSIDDTPDGYVETQVRAIVGLEPCRRWNWRQCSRTQLSPATTRGLFIIDALGSEALAAATAAGDDLEQRLRALDPAVGTARHVLVAPRI